ncbi:GNAT family N-acetyltransferase [Sedimentibacter sp. zth1]|uniref:GNAT family N-acetyltransferase n=1 Tax=Sedimentibacter sp. zth1 TaxID=2816908 RepID=UPI001A91F8C0|nr:GNAT family N-acetyltransferase [Sedimentibacter sp. zth1]QSX06673.1 GNAT family N-acetyltransferase [Sedimentibacter sp. zth1]
MREYYFKEVKSKQFSIYHTIYSKEDINMWFDWKMRLDETSLKENCYFVFLENICIGGVIIEDDEISNSFLIPPYNDRELFWKIVIDYIKRKSKLSCMHFAEMLKQDTEVLQNLGAKISEQRNYMCRPTENIEMNINKDFILENVKEQDYEELALVQIKAYRDSCITKYVILNDKDELVSGLKEDIEAFKQTNTYSMTSIVREKSTNKIVGGCISGRYDEAPNMFGCIFELYVLSEYRKLGFGKAMVNNALSVDFTNTPVIKLNAYIEDTPAISLYNKLGFISGGIFTDLVLHFYNETRN